jgi:hypothetical protein
MLKMFFGLLRLRVPNPILLTKLGCTKLSVAPESTSAFMSAMLYFVQIKTGTFIEQKQVIYTELQRNALAQAARFRHLQNPYPS